MTQPLHLSLLHPVREHASGMPARVTSDAFIGRRVELTHLDAALSHARTDLGDSELPYAPIVSALRSLVRRGHPVFDDLGPARGELRRGTG